MDKKKYFQMAKAVSYTSNHKRVHIGAIILKKKRLISAAANSIKSHPLQKKLNKYRFTVHDTCKNSMHAELSAILKANESLQGASMFIYRENKHGEIAMCRPCPACMKMIKSSGIKLIYYTTDHGFCMEEIKKD